MTGVRSQMFRGSAEGLKTVTSPVTDTPITELLLAPLMVVRSQGEILPHVPGRKAGMNTLRYHL